MMTILVVETALLGLLEKTTTMASKSPKSIGIENPVPHPSQLGLPRYRVWCLHYFSCNWNRRPCLSNDLAPSASCALQFTHWSTLATTLSIACPTAALRSGVDCLASLALLPNLSVRQLVESFASLLSCGRHGSLYGRTLLAEQPQRGWERYRPGIGHCLALSVWYFRFRHGRRNPLGISIG